MRSCSNTSEASRRFSTATSVLNVSQASTPITIQIPVRSKSAGEYGRSGGGETHTPRYGKRGDLYSTDGIPVLCSCHRNVCILGPRPAGMEWKGLSTREERVRATASYIIEKL
jgi:hypothetical protein